MKRALMLAAALCLCALGAENTAVAPQQATSCKPQAASMGPDAIAIPLMLSYQGKLTDTLGQPVPNGNYQLTFRLYTVPSGGSAFWTEGQTILVRNGLFSALLGAVTPISLVPDSGALYLGLQVAVDPELSPRLRIASAAYSYLAARAASADLLQGKDTTGFVRTGQAGSVTSAMVVDGAIAAADLGQMDASSGQVMKWTGSAWEARNDSVGTGGGGDNAWVRAGSDSVLYTVHRLGIARGGASNMLHGTNRFTHNNLGVACTTGTSGQNHGYAAVCGGYMNAASWPYSTIAGGDSNRATGTGTFVGGGHYNRAVTDYATVAGGFGNSATGLFGGALSGRGHLVGGTAFDSAACVAGGWNNDLESKFGFIGGGRNNVVLGGNYGTVGGGLYNRVAGAYAAVVGGDSNQAGGTRSVVGGGHRDSTGANYCGVLSGNHNVAGRHAADSCAAVCGGQNNVADSTWALVGGGFNNKAGGQYSTVGGGYSNEASTNYAFVGGGFNNAASGYYAFVGGGGQNIASGTNSCVAGGYADTASADYSFAVNYNSSATHSNSAAFNGQATTASDQTRVGILSKASGTFTIDHPLDPTGKILNHYFIEGPEMRNIYDGEAVLDASGRAVVTLPDYFDALNRAPRVQLTGVGTNQVVYVAEDVSGNRFTIGGPAGAKVYWQVTGEREDVSAEVTRRMMPVEQPKTGPLAGRMLDDDFLRGAMDQLVREGKAEGIDFRTAAGRAKYERMKQHLREAGQR